VGWCYGAAHLIKPMVLANQWTTYCVSTPTQQALAEVLSTAELPYEGFSNYFQYVCAEYERKRNGLVAALESAELKPIVPEGGFFIVADTSAHSFPEKYALQPGPNGQVPVTHDWAFARWLTCDVGVTPIPMSAFYEPERAYLAKDLSRFACCKTDATLEEGKKRLEALGAKIKAKDAPI
jgi:aspartate/methionine/tyrosine aminotransferase